MVRKKRHQKGYQIDYVILTSVILLVLIGFVALASASSDLGKSKFDDTYFYLKHQGLYGLSLGIVGFFLAYHLDYRKYKKKMAPVLLFLGLGLLLLTFSPLGASQGGAARWLQIGPATVQPSELLKVFFTIYLAAWLAGVHRDRQKSLAESFLPFLAISGIVAGLLLIQRSTSAAVILMASALTIYFVGGAKKKYIFGTIALGLVVLSVVVIATPYRLQRVKSFLDKEANLETTGYQVDQALTTIGSGGVWGVGYGQSSLKRSLPEQIGDSIFAIIAEEFGFVGASVVILLFLILVIRIFIVAGRMPDQFGKLLLVGLGTIVGAQAFIHIGANSGVIPLTGVPLPFISYGGTALAVFMTMGGIMLNVSKHAR